MGTDPSKLSDDPTELASERRVSPCRLKDSTMVFHEETSEHLALTPGDFWVSLDD